MADVRILITKAGRADAFGTPMAVGSTPMVSVDHATALISQGFAMWYDNNPTIPTPAPSLTPSAIDRQSPLRPMAFAGNDRVTVLLPQANGASTFTVRASTGQSVVAAATAQFATLPGLTNGVAVTVTVAATYPNGDVSPASLPSRSVTPSAIAGLGDIGIDPYLYFDPNRLGLSNGASVATLPDLSGNGYNATQTVGGNQPTFVTNAVNGKGILNGSGSQWLTFPGTQGDHGGAFIDISAWALNNGTPSDNRYYSNQQSTTDTYFVSADANGTAAQATPKVRMQLPAQSPHTLPDAGTANFILSVALTTRAPGRAYVNGALQSAPTAPGLCYVDRRTWQIFGYGGNNKVINGRMLHFSRWPASMTQAQRWAVEAYLASQFAITVTQA